MGFKITVQPSQHVFEAEPDETILAAALRQGLSAGAAVWPAIGNPCLRPATVLCYTDRSAGPGPAWPGVR